MSAALETLREGAWEAWRELVNAHEALTARKTPESIETFEKALIRYRLAFETYDAEVVERVRVGARPQ